MSFKNSDLRDEEPHFPREHRDEHMHRLHRQEWDEHRHHSEDNDRRRMHDMPERREEHSRPHNKMSMDMNNSSKRSSNGRSKSHDSGMGMYGSGLTSRDLMEIASILKNRPDYCTMKEMRERESRLREEEEFPRPEQFRMPAHMMNRPRRSENNANIEHEEEDMQSHKPARKASTTRKASSTTKSRSTSAKKEPSSSSSRSTTKRTSESKSSNSTSGTRSKTKTATSSRVPRVAAKREKKTRS